MKGNTMATMRKHYGKWQTIVRIKGHPTVYKSFDQKTDAKRWSNFEGQLYCCQCNIL